MSVESELFALERKFWTGDADHYRSNLDDRCLVVFTQMSGVMSKEQVASTVEGGRRWRELQIEPKGFLQLGSDLALLSYEANAQRENGERYKALVSSGYAKRDGAWKMAFHQQTPLTA